MGQINNSDTERERVVGGATTGLQQRERVDYLERMAEAELSRVEKGH